MTKPNDEKGVVVKVEDPSQSEGKLKDVAGSKSDILNRNLIAQVVDTLWLKDAKDDEQLAAASMAALAGIGPRDEIEGMLGAQMIAAHNASMEYYRRATISEHLESKAALDQGSKLSRTYTTLLEALNRHRGKGQQKVTVEHVHVHAGGQAIVGHVETGGVAVKNKRQPHAKSLPHAPVTPLRSGDEERELVPLAGDAER